MGWIHDQSHPAAGQRVTVTAALLLDQSGNVVQAEIEDWVDRLINGSWRFAGHSPAAVAYSVRRQLCHLPNDDEVVYVTTSDGMAHLVHASEMSAIHSAPADMRQGR